MSKSKKTKKLSTDLRVGNFVYHLENDYVKVYDINEMASHRVSTLIPKGQQLKIAIESAKEGDERANIWLQQYAVVMFNALCCVFDIDFLSNVNKEAMDVIERHKKLYYQGVTDEFEDAKVLNEVRESQEFIEEIKKDITE